MLSNRERLLRSISEKEWTRQVIQLARLNGWRVHHSRPGMLASGQWVTPLHGDAGLPDLILVRPPRVLFVELKRQAGGIVSATQANWLRDLAICPGVETAIWRPGDLTQAQQTLRREAGRGLARPELAPLPSGQESA